MKSKTGIMVFAMAFALLWFACGNQESRDKNQEPDKKSQTTQQKQVYSDSIPSDEFDFEDYPTGQLPSGWSEYYTGAGGTDWIITNDNGNKVLAQLYSDNPNNHFNVVVNDSIIAKDMALTVRLKGVTGNHDKGGGFVWRFLDKNNYYVVRANPLEDNMVLYKVEDGKRKDLPLIGKGKTYGLDVPSLGNSWNSMELVVKGDVFTIYLNNKEIFKVKDTTFTKAGKVGLWTKADAVTYFDDFSIKILD